MKYSEYLIEISKAFKDKNSASILQLVVNEPFYANKSIGENKSLQEEYIQHAKKNEFFKQVFAAGRHPHIGELTSKPSHIVPRIIREREFPIYCAEKMNVISDFLSTSTTEPGMFQVKNTNTADDDHLLKYYKRNWNVTNVIEIYANNNKITKEYENLENPSIRIIEHKNIPKVSRDAVLEMEEEFNNQKSNYLKVKNEQAKPLWEKHKTLVKNNPIISEEATFETLKNYSFRANEKEERAFFLEQIKKVENIKYRN